MTRWTGRRMGLTARALLVALCAGGVAPACAAGGAPDPLQALYRVEGQPVRLSGGLAEAPAAPGSAARVRTAVFGRPIHGDLDGDGVDDAVLLLLHEAGGSGTFTYVAAAIRARDGYRGTDAVLLGDRVAPQTMAVRNGVVTVNYADRLPGEPLTAPPREGVTAYLVLREGRLVFAYGPRGNPGETVEEGWLTIGHEARSFEPCGDGQPLWIPGGAPALGELKDAYRRSLPEAPPYAPLFAVVAGRRGERTAEGFGAEYTGSFLATRLVQVWPRGNCRSEHLVLDEPAPGQVVTSPLTVRGRARGTWFFEGDFPIELRDARGELEATHYATAQGEWMTEDFVPFEGRLEFPKPEQPRRGVLVLRKDNPSDDRSLDDAVEIPVTFR